MFRFNKGKETTVVQYKRKEQKLHNEQLFQSLKASLGSGTMIHRAVKLPPNEDINRHRALQHYFVVLRRGRGVLYHNNVPQDVGWSVRLKPLFIIFNFFSGTDALRSAVEYRWQKDRSSAAVIVPAPEYVDLLADWTFAQLSDPTIFPDSGNGYPKNFPAICKKILTRLFRVFGHIYHSHWEDVKRVGAEPHMNTSFKHFYFFVNEFKLLEESDMVPVMPLIEKIREEHQ